jgi:signal transduction histidine kinase
MVGNDLELTVSDNGAGFDLQRYQSPEERKKHFGLISMGERASLLGGCLDIDTAPGAGTRVRASLPIHVDRAITACDSSDPAEFLG